MAVVSELRKYMMSFATHEDIVAARQWLTACGDVARLLREKEGELLDAWKRLFLAAEGERREIFLGLEEITRHLLLVRAADLYTSRGGEGHLPHLDELAQRVLVRVFEQYLRGTKEK